MRAGGGGSEAGRRLPLPAGQLATARTSGDTTGLSRRIGQQEPFGQGRIGGVAYDFSPPPDVPHFLLSQRQSRARCHGPVTGGRVRIDPPLLCLVITRLASKLLLSNLKRTRHGKDTTTLCRAKLVLMLIIADRAVVTSASALRTLPVRASCSWSALDARPEHGSNHR
jgi:hypothetical protein